jgi:hypothetical protein
MNRQWKQQIMLLKNKFIGQPTKSAVNLTQSTLVTTRKKTSVQRAWKNVTRALTCSVTLESLHEKFYTVNTSEIHWTLNFCISPRIYIKSLQHARWSLISDCLCGMNWIARTVSANFYNTKIMLKYCTNVHCTNFSNFTPRVTKPYSYHEGWRKITNEVIHNTWNFQDHYKSHETMLPYERNKGCQLIQLVEDWPLSCLLLEGITIPSPWKVPVISAW